QQVIAFESGVADFVDPLAGSYAVEALTDHIEAGARDYIERIDEMGGAVSASGRGFQASEIQEAACQAPPAGESGRPGGGGVNRYQTDEQAAVEGHRVDDAIEREQVERLRQFKASRAASQVEAAREQLARAARGSDNLMPHIVAAVRANVTLGEISDTLRDVF